MNGKLTKVEFIESYIKHGNGGYEWNDNHGELVRCKDCKHSKHYENGTLYGCVFGDGLREGDWYCADGVKKQS